MDDSGLLPSSPNGCQAEWNVLLLFLVIGVRIKSEAKQCTPVKGQLIRPATNRSPVP